MVQRKGLKKAAIGSKDAKRGSQDDDERLGKRKMGGRRVQRKGELDLSNPMIPADLDEDIDDDLAFNSDDEAKYGHLFSKAEEPASRKKGTTKAGKQGGLSSEFDRLNAYGDNDDDLFSDDSRDGFDLSEMLDSREDRKQAKAARRNKKEGRKTAPNDLLTREAESLLGPVAEGTRKPAGLHDLINNAPEGAAARRLDASMRNKKNLLSEEVDELVKERTGRTKTREAVADKLKQYTTILNVHSDAAHLKFPLQVPNANPVPGTLGSLTTALGAKQNSVTESSKKMNDLLRAAGLGGLRPSTTAPDEQIKFSTDDVADDDEQVTSHEKPSAGYMMKLKSMLSYEIAKRKRFNKIKSKTYRRILRKEKDREQERRDKAFELLNPEAAKARMQEKMEKIRAEERATQKHKNTSKWVKHAKAFAKFDDDTKDAINEQHALRQRLMAKMTEDAGAEFEDAADNVSESSEEEMRVDELLKGDKDVSSILWQDSGKTSTDATPTDKARSELFQMSFMTRAKERSNAQLEAEAAALQEDIKQYQEGRELTQASNRLLNKREKKARQALDDEEEGVQDAPKQSTRNAVNKSAGRTKVAENPQHLKHSVTLKQQRGARSTEESAVPAGEIDLDRDEEQWDESAHTAAATGTNTNEFAGSRRATPTPSTRVRVLPVSTKRQREEESSQSAVVSFAEQKEEEVDLQQYLIARAFAADDIDADFLKAKEAQVESIMKPEDKNVSLPGWGEWGGEDERLNKQHKKRAEVSQMQRRIQMTTLMKARADAQLNNVIINHDVDIVPDRHTLHMVPRPFSNPTEFARSMRQPLGPEWNTSLSFKEGAQPRITTTQGVAIDPLDLHSQRKKAKTVRRKLAKKNSD